MHFMVLTLCFPVYLGLSTETVPWLISDDLVEVVSFFPGQTMMVAIGMNNLV